MWLSLDPTVALLTAALLAAAFVLTLYAWRHPVAWGRDHPVVIRQRMLSTAVTSAVAVAAVWAMQFASSTPPPAGTSSPPVAEWIGVPTDLSSYPAALALPLLLTLSLFSGPLLASAMEACCDEQTGRLRFSPSALVSSLLSSWCVLWTPGEAWKSARNLIAAPIAEELVFRSAVLALLLAGGWSFSSCVLLSPALFGLAHVHHLLNLTRSRGLPLRVALLSVLFQLGYTTAFGAYATFVYLRTGHLLSVVAVHTLCNFLGFPSLGWMSPSHPLYSRRHVIQLAVVAGVVAFSLALWPLTEPQLYANEARQLPWIVQYQRMRLVGAIEPPAWRTAAS